MANLKKNLAYNFLLSCSQVLIPLISIPYVSEVLNPAGIGRVSFIDSLCYYFVIIAEFGIVAYGTREVARLRHEKDKLQKLVAELLALHGLATLVTLVLYGITVFLLWQKIQDIRIVLLSIAFLLSNAFVCEWYFWGTEKFRYITLRSVITRLLGLAAMFILVKQPADYYIYYGITVAAAILTQAANLGSMLTQLPLSFKQLNWRRHLRSTSVMYLISLFYSVTVVLDNVLLGMVSTAAALGLYAFSVKIVRIGSNVITDIFVVLYPHMATQLQEGDNARVKQTIHRSVQLLTLITVPAGVGIFLLSEPIVRALLAKSFYSASGNLYILAALPFIKTYSLFLGKQLLMSYRKEKLYLYGLIAGSLFFVCCTLVLSHFFNDRGASYALILGETLILIICCYYVKKNMPGLPLFDWPALLQSLVGSALFIPVIWLIEKNIASPIVVIILSVLICIPVYFLFQFFVMKNKLLLHLYRSGTGEKGQHFFIQEHLHKQVQHGSVGNVDVEKIFLSQNYGAIVFPCKYDLSFKAKIVRLRFLISIFFSIPPGAVVVFQHPLYAKMHILLVNWLRWKKVHVICCIADIEGKRLGDAAMHQREIKWLKQFSYFIVHNPAMAAWLQSIVPGCKYTQIEFFDFLTTPATVSRQKNYQVVFAGNFEKAPFVKDLGNLPAGVTFHLYGPFYHARANASPDVHYKGVFEPGELVQRLTEGFGLVWDGTSVESCSGSYGEYLWYNSPHKLSLYILAGLPLIVPRGSACAYMVEKYGIGCTVDRLSDLKPVIDAIDEPAYQRMVQNTRALAARISTGKCLGDALEAIEREIRP